MKLAKQEISKTAFIYFSIATAFILCYIFCPNILLATEAEYTTTITGILDKMIEVIGTIFKAVGIILAVYSVGQLIMAFKNEDADSKTRASTMLVVSVILMAFDTIVTSLNLTSYL